MVGVFSVPSLLGEGRMIGIFERRWRSLPGCSHSPGLGVLRDGCISRKKCELPVGNYYRKIVFLITFILELEAIGLCEALVVST